MGHRARSAAVGARRPHAGHADPVARRCCTDAGDRVGERRQSDARADEGARGRACHAQRAWRIAWPCHSPDSCGEHGAGGMRRRAWSRARGLGRERARAARSGGAATPRGDRGQQPDCRVCRRRDRSCRVWLWSVASVARITRASDDRPAGERAKHVRPSEPALAAASCVERARHRPGAARRRRVAARQLRAPHLAESRIRSARSRRRRCEPAGLEIPRCGSTNPISRGRPRAIVGDAWRTQRRHGDAGADAAYDHARRVDRRPAGTASRRSQSHGLLDRERTIFRDDGHTAAARTSPHSRRQPPIAGRRRHQ